MKLFFLQLVKMAKRLKKEKVSVDVINFGEEVIVNQSCTLSWTYNVFFLHAHL